MHQPQIIIKRRTTDLALRIRRSPDMHGYAPKVVAVINARHGEGAVTNTLVYNVVHGHIKNHPLAPEIKTEVETLLDKTEEVDA
jgi:hypothetical protein